MAPKSFLICLSLRYAAFVDTDIRSDILSVCDAKHSRRSFPFRADYRVVQCRLRVLANCDDSFRENDREEIVRRPFAGSTVAIKDTRRFYRSHLARDSRLTRPATELRDLKIFKDSLSGPVY